MSFVNKNNKIRIFSLQSQKSANISSYTSRRTFFHTSFNASFTIEAALGLPLFIFLMATIMYFIVIIGIQLNIQIQLEDTAGKIAKNAYLSENIEVMNYVYAKVALEDSDFQDYIDSTYIVNGSDGISILESSFFSDTGIVDLVLSYDIEIPFLPEKYFVIPCISRCRFHTWVGNSIAEQEDNEEIVYITKTGSVYHTDRECSHLKLSISQLQFGQVEIKRNAQGGKYDECKLCDGEDICDTSIVYITEDGDKWHHSLECSGLKREVIEIDYSEIGDKSLCSRCRGE